MSRGPGYAAAVEIVTASGAAHAVVDKVTDPGCLVVLTHGAGGGVEAPDLLAVRRAGLELGAMVARVVQPYRMRGARAPGSAARQDTAWLEIIAALRKAFPGVPLVQGGRSNGARVACRTARAARARAVIALAFPLHPPGRPERSRAAELLEAGTDVLVVNGDADPFGVPQGSGAIHVVTVPGEGHALSRAPEKAGAAVSSWLGELLSANRADRRRE